jgi:hypothetical protein
MYMVRKKVESNLRTRKDLITKRNVLSKFNIARRVVKVPYPRVFVELD